MVVRPARRRIRGRRAGCRSCRNGRAACRRSSGTAGICCADRAASTVRPAIRAGSQRGTDQRNRRSYTCMTATRRPTTSGAIPRSVVSRNHAPRHRPARRRPPRGGHARLRPPVALAGSPLASGADRRPHDRRRSIGAASTCCSASATDTLLVHLGMTGSLRAFTRRAAAPPARPRRHRARLRRDAALPRPAPLRRDALAAAARRRRIRCSRALGPEPFDPAFDADYLWRATRRRTAAIKLALMDNHLVVGVGNIYANESLFRAGIRPTTPANRVSQAAARAARRRGPRDADRRDRQGRIDAARLRRQPRRARLLPARLLRLRPRGLPCRRLRHRHPRRSGRAAARRSIARAASADAVRGVPARCAAIRHVICLSRRARFDPSPTPRTSDDAAGPPERADAPSRDLAARFEAYSDWRRRLSAGISALHDWLQRAGPGRRAGRPQGPAAARAPAPGQARRRVRRRVLARQVRAHQRDLLRRFRRSGCCRRRPAARRCARPSSSTTRRAPPSIRLLPIETRLKDATVAEFKNYADEWVTFPLDLSAADKMSEALARVSQVKRVPVALARKYGLYDDEDSASPALEPSGDGARRHPVLAPRGHQLPASAAAAGARDPRHAGPERDRHRARAHAQPAAQRARGAVHPRRRRRRHQDRPRGVEPASRRRRPGARRPAASSS